MTPVITVLLADDHHLVRRGFRRLLEDDARILVVGEAPDGDEAVRLACELKPRIVVMDAAMPGTGGLAATRAIVARLPDTRVLILSMHSEETVVRQAEQAGASGYILKNALDLDLTSAVVRIAEGQRLFPDARDAQRPGDRMHLTPRELEVLRLICDGRTNREIAGLLDVSINTVAVHRANIMNALGVHKTAELVVYALQNGLVNPL